jgi:hypothetical protein
VTVATRGIQGLPENSGTLYVRLVDVFDVCVHQVCGQIISFHNRPCSHSFGDEVLIGVELIVKHMWG